MIEIRGLTRSFGSVMAVNSVNLEIQQGVLFGLLGPNGAGKSTLINLICGLLRPDSGSVNFSGMPGNGPNPVSRTTGREVFNADARAIFGT